VRIGSIQPPAIKDFTFRRDLEIAGNLKATINDLMARIDVGPTPMNEVPVSQSSTGHWVDPKTGNRLISVGLTEIWGAEPITYDTALVDPLTNKFFIVHYDRTALVETYAGPINLPEHSRFTHRSYTAEKYERLERAANPFNLDELERA
jgi:hypothetical protein